MGKFTWIVWMVVVLQFIVICYLYRKLEQTKVQACNSPVSGLTNKFGLVAVLRPIFGRLRRGLIKKITVVAIDLDHFKPVNDRYGHKNGDKVLKVAGEILLYSTRPDDVVAHLSGDEFVIIFSDTEDKVVFDIMKRAQKKFSQYHFSFADGDKVETNFTYGVASSTFSDAQFEAVYHSADTDCNERKERMGGSRYKPTEL